MKIRIVCILFTCSCVAVTLCLSNLCKFSSKNVKPDNEIIGLTVKDAKTNSISEFITFCLGRENISFKASLCDETCYCYQNSNGIISNTTCKSVEYEYTYAINCFDIYRCYSLGNGIYTITVEGKPLKVFCDMDRGGWTFLHRRLDGSVNFERNFSDYQSGFGSLSGEYWLGLDNIHSILTSGLYDVRFDMKDFNETEGYAEYSDFYVANSTFNYKLQISGYTGNMGNRIEYYNGQGFSTIDVDNDSWKTGNCAKKNRGGWWYNLCFTVNLNGVYNSTYVWAYSKSLWIPFKAASFRYDPNSN